MICYLLAAGSAPLNERDPSVQLPIVSRYPHKDGGGGGNAAGDPGPWTGTAAGADQTDPYSLIEKFRSLYHRFCRLLDASASPRFLLRSACSDQGSGFVWTAPPFIKNNRQVTGCTRKPYPSRHPTGKRYQSHAATIRRWAGEDAKKAAPPTRNRDYSVKEDE